MLVLKQLTYLLSYNTFPRAGQDLQIEIGGLSRRSYEALHEKIPKFRNITRRRKKLVSVVAHSVSNVTVKHCDVTNTVSVVIVWDVKTKFVNKVTIFFENGFYIIRQIRRIVVCTIFKWEKNRRSRILNVFSQISPVLEKIRSRGGDG